MFPARASLVHMLSQHGISNGNQRLKFFWFFNDNFFSQLVMAMVGDLTKIKILYTSLISTEETQLANLLFNSPSLRSEPDIVINSGKDKGERRKRIYVACHWADCSWTKGKNVQSQTVVWKVFNWFVC